MMMNLIKKLKQVNYRFIILHSLLGLLLMSCKETEKSIKVKYGIYANNLDSLTNISENKFKILSLKGKGVYNLDNSTQNFDFRVNIIKDSLLFISISKLGIEGFRVLASKDSVKILDRLQKKYCISDFNLFDKLIGKKLSLNTFQSLLIGELPNEIKNAFFEKRTKDKIYFKFKNNIENASIIYDARNLKIVDLNLNNDLNSAIVSYQKFKTIANKFVIANDVFMYFDSNKKTTVKLHYNNIDFESDNATFNFVIPNNYEQYDF